MRAQFSRSSIQFDLFICVLFIFYFFTIVFLALPPTIFLLQQVAFLFEPPALSAQTIQLATQQAWQITVLRYIPTHSAFFTQNEVSHLVDVNEVLWAWLVPLFVLASVIASVRYASYFRYNKMSAKIALQIIPRRIGVFVLLFCVLSFFLVLIFPTFFNAFHRFFFPRGNYEFLASSVLIQIFPLTFWALEFSALQMGVLGLVLLFWLRARKNFDILASLKMLFKRKV